MKYLVRSYEFGYHNIIENYFRKKHNTYRVITTCEKYIKYKK